MVQVPTITLNDGTKMPAFGLGTYSGSSGSIHSESRTLSEDGKCERAVKEAIDAGYRHFDTAYFYENEHEVGKAIKDKITERAIQRDDVYIVTKLWCHFHDPERVEGACRKSLDNLGLEYIDCYLMHWPYGYVYEADNVMVPKNAKGEGALSDVDYVDTWKSMEKLVELGLTKSIGVSNFNSEQLERLFSVAKIKPVHNQVELGAVPIPKSVTKSRIEENINIFDFKLDAEDHKVLEEYNDDKRIFPMDHAMKSKYYPFHIKY